MFVLSGFIIQSIALAGLGHCDSSNPMLAYVLLVMAVGGGAGGKSGFFVNQLDIAPNHSGTLMGIVNGLGNIFGIFSTVACQYLVRNEVRFPQFQIFSKKLFQYHKHI